MIRLAAIIFALACLGESLRATSAGGIVACLLGAAAGVMFAIGGDK